MFIARIFQIFPGFIALLMAGLVIVTILGIVGGPEEVERIVGGVKQTFGSFDQVVELIGQRR